MKKKLLTFALLLAGLTGAHASVDAGAIVSITNIRNVVQGYTGSFDVVLNDANTNTFVSLGLDVQLPAGFTYTGYAAGELLTASHVSNISTSDQGSNTIRFGSFANPTADFTAQTGTLLTIYFSVAASAASGTAYVKEASFTIGSESHYATNASALLTVGNMVTLSENATQAPAPISGVNVTVERTLKSDVWNTIVLPFAMTGTQVTNTFGEGTQIGEFDNYDVTGSQISVKFKAVDAIAAHTPYIIKVPRALTQFSVSGVNITTATNNLTINKGTNNKPHSMVGTYVPAVVPNNRLYILDNKFKYSKGNSKIKGFRAYFAFDDFDYEALSRSITIDFSEATGIREVESVSTGDGCYHNLSGQRVSQPSKGLYIVNGKKVIIR